MGTGQPNLPNWIGVVGGGMGIASSIANFYILWTNRRRIVFRVVSANAYYIPWTSTDIAKARWPSPLGTTPATSEGSCRTLFVVVEFTVGNEYLSELSVGRFMVNDWMFADHYTRGDYAPKQDYQVFDLYSRATVSLDSYAKVPAKGTLGLRIEVLEKTDGPEWVSSKSRYTLDLPKSYTVKFHTDVGDFTRKIKFARARAMGLGGFDDVHRWGHLLGVRHSDVSGAPLPQGLNYDKHAWDTWQWRLRNRISWLWFKIKMKLGWRPKL